MDNRIKTLTEQIDWLMKENDLLNSLLIVLLIINVILLVFLFVKG